MDNIYQDFVIAEAVNKDCTRWVLYNLETSCAESTPLRMRALHDNFSSSQEGAKYITGGFSTSSVWHTILGIRNRHPLLTPALYIMKERDVATSFPGYEQVVAKMRAAVPQLKEILVFPGCGHWTQQERPEELKNALITFLKDLA